MIHHSIAAVPFLENADNEIPLAGLDRGYRQAVTALEHPHRGKIGMGTQLPDADQTRLFDQGDIDVEPARVVARGLWIEVRALAVELGRVRMRRSGHPYDAGNAGLRATGVVKECAVADFHPVAHEIARLIVAYAPPSGGPLRRGRQVID